MLVGNRMMNLIDGQICQLLKPLEPGKAIRRAKKTLSGFKDEWSMVVWYVYLYIYIYIIYIYIYI